MKYQIWVSDPRTLTRVNGRSRCVLSLVSDHHQQKARPDLQDVCARMIVQPASRRPNDAEDSMLDKLVLRGYSVEPCLSAELLCIQHLVPSYPRTLVPPSGDQSLENRTCTTRAFRVLARRSGATVVPRDGKYFDTGVNGSNNAFR
jgi:hypothetical protein